MNNTRWILAAGILLLSTTFSFAQTKELQTEQAKKDYAPSAAASDAPKITTLEINPDQLNIVAGNLGKFDAGVKPVFRNHMNLWEQPKSVALLKQLKKAIREK